MNKLLIYIGDSKKFDVPATIEAIRSIEGVSKARSGKFIGAVFECEFSSGDTTTIIRISDSEETITAESIGDVALDFALRLQSKLPVPLFAIDMDYSFNIPITTIRSVEEMRRAMAA